MVFIKTKLIRFFTDGIALWPFAFIIPEKYQEKKIRNHEKIHGRQQLELFIIGFYIWYLLEYFIKQLYYLDHDKAYRNISFEREAYDQDQNLNYLKYRKWYSFLKYLD